MEKKKNPKIKILVCCHKPDKWLSDDVYMPIHCGKAISSINLGIQGDDTGDNISKKNVNYCELTAMYWAWKNLKDVDYIGLCHYRRYFDFKYKGIRNSICATTLKYIEKPSVNTIINYDVILARPYTMPFNMYTWYSVCHHSDDIKLVKKIIHKKYPELISNFEHVMRGNKFPAYNMFIMKKDIFDDYCRWLFDILNDIEGELKIQDYNSYQKRAIAFIAERLLPVYFNSLNYKKTYIPICQFMGKNTNIIKWIAKQVVCNLSFLFNKRVRYGEFYEK